MKISRFFFIFLFFALSLYARQKWGSLIPRWKIEKSSLYYASHNKSKIYLSGATNNTCPDIKLLSKQKLKLKYSYNFHFLIASKSKQTICGLAVILQNNDIHKFQIIQDGNSFYFEEDIRINKQHTTTITKIQFITLSTNTFSYFPSQNKIIINQTTKLNTKPLKANIRSIFLTAKNNDIKFLNFSIKNKNKSIIFDDFNDSTIIWLNPLLKIKKNYPSSPLGP